MDVGVFHVVWVAVPLLEPSLEHPAVAWPTHTALQQAASHVDWGGCPPMGPPLEQLASPAQPTLTTMGQAV